MTTRIIGTGCYIPEIRITNDDLSEIMDTSDEWIRTRTGIRERHITDQGTTFMSIEAAKKACDDANIPAAKIDLIIVATSSSDYCFPNCACEIQAAIGAVKAAAFDVSVACAGFIYALNTAHAFIQAGIYQTALVIGAESMSRLMNWDDRSTCVLFGDGAGAVLVRNDNTGIMALDLGADGTRGDVLMSKNSYTGSPFREEEQFDRLVTMNGQEVFKFAVKKVPESVNAVLKTAAVHQDDIRYYILHQANERIIQSVSKRMGLPMEKFPINLMHYGNTSAASVPILLDELNKEGKLLKGDYLVLSGFGAGLTWGTTLLTW